MSTEWCREIDWGFVQGKSFGQGGGCVTSTCEGGVACHRDDEARATAVKSKHKRLCTCERNEEGTCTVRRSSSPSCRRSRRTRLLLLPGWVPRWSPEAFQTF